MSLFATGIITTTPAEQRTAIAAAKIKSDVLIYGQTMLSSLDKLHRECLALVWANPDLTPQEAIAAMGTDAVTIFTVSAATTDFLAAQYAAAGEAYAAPTLPEGVVLTPNPDGTMSVFIPEPPPPVEPDPELP